MRKVFVLVVASCLTAAYAQADKKPAQRYGIEADLANYPQAAPKETLDSILKAIERKRVDYLLAQLSDPQFVDKRVKDYGGNFEELVREATARFVDDPESVRKLRRILKDGEWEMDETTATARLKDIKERVFMKKIDERWFLENRTKVEAPAK